MESSLPLPFLLWFLTTRLAAAVQGLLRIPGFFKKKICYFDTFIVLLSHKLISGYGIMAISVLQSAQEIELHAQFAQHYLARHYSGL